MSNAEEMPCKVQDTLHYVTLGVLGGFATFAYILLRLPCVCVLESI